MARPQTHEAGNAGDGSALVERTRVGTRDPGIVFRQTTVPPIRPCRRWSIGSKGKNAVRRVKKIGNAHIFEAAVSRAGAQHRIIDELLSFFGGKSSR